MIRTVKVDRRNMLCAANPKPGSGPAAALDQYATLVLSHGAPMSSHVVEFWAVVHV